MNDTYRAIWHALTVNMGYREGEEVAIVLQEWRDDTPAGIREKLDRSRELGETMADCFAKNGALVSLYRYQPPLAQNGADAAPELYEQVGTPAVAFLPTVFSLTHTAFRRHLTSLGTRVASMPSFTLEMFAPGGPMDLDYQELHEQTRAMADRLAASPFVRITGPGTTMVVEVDTDHVHCSSGLLTARGAWGNLPGAEAYAPPVHLGRSRGHFTVPAGWGGNFPLPEPLTFRVEGGRMVEVTAESKAGLALIEERILPILRGGEGYDVLAELGLGTNQRLDGAYIAKHGWSTLVAEKIGGSAHFANGNSLSMGGRNDVPIHIDWVVPGIELEFFSSDPG